MLRESPGDGHVNSSDVPRDGHVNSSDVPRDGAKVGVKSPPLPGGGGMVNLRFEPHIRVIRVGHDSPRTLFNTFE